ncbi:MAG: NAD-dependent epimerase/dehydratase family protein, partial [Candidatus Altarchaeaceae archaeon]
RIKPLSPYGASKFSVECYLHSFYKIYGLDYCALRYGNVYGDRQDPLGEAGVIAIFFGRILKNLNPIIYGDGNQTRDFVYVKDVVDVTIKAMGKTRYKEYNVGTGKETSVNELVKILEKIFNRKIQPIYAPERKGEVRRIYLNIERIKNEFKFNPLDIEEGMRKTYEWIKNGK